MCCKHSVQCADPLYVQYGCRLFPDLACGVFVNITHDTLKASCVCLQLHIHTRSHPAHVLSEPDRQRLLLNSDALSVASWQLDGLFIPSAEPPHLPRPNQLPEVIICLIKAWIESRLRVFNP